MKKSFNLLNIILIIISIILLFLFIGEKRKSETILNAYQTIDNSLDVGISQFTLTSAKGDFSRGGYIIGEGNDLNWNKIKFYYDWGWCSSGGQDCGFDFCVSAPAIEENYVYSLMKENICERFDEANKLECLSNKFEKIVSGRIIFAVTLTDDLGMIEGPNKCGD